MVTLPNPEAIAFYLAVLPAIVDLRELTLPGFVPGAALIAVMLFTVLGFYSVAAHAVRGFFRSLRAFCTLNCVSRTAIAGAAIAIAHTVDQAAVFSSIASSFGKSTGLPNTPLAPFSMAFFSRSSAL